MSENHHSKLLVFRVYCEGHMWDSNVSGISHTTDASVTHGSHAILLTLCPSLWPTDIIVHVLVINKDWGNCV